MKGNIILYNHEQLLCLFWEGLWDSMVIKTVTTNLEQIVSSDLWAGKRLQDSLPIP